MKSHKSLVGYIACFGMFFSNYFVLCSNFRFLLILLRYNLAFQSIPKRGPRSWGLNRERTLLLMDHLVTYFSLYENSEIVMQKFISSLSHASQLYTIGIKTEIGLQVCYLSPCIDH